MIIIVDESIETIWTNYNQMGKESFSIFFSSFFFLFVNNLPSFVNNRTTFIFTLFHYIALYRVSKFKFLFTFQNHYSSRFIPILEQ